MTDTAEAHAAPATDTADTTNTTDVCADNANDTMPDNGGIPRISKREYGKQLHSLLTKQPMKKYLCDKN